MYFRLSDRGGAVFCCIRHVDNVSAIFSSYISRVATNAVSDGDLIRFEVVTIFSHLAWSVGNGEQLRNGGRGA